MSSPCCSKCSSSDVTFIFSTSRKKPYVSRNRLSPFVEDCRFRGCHLKLVSKKQRRFSFKQEDFPYTDLCSDKIDHCTSDDSVSSEIDFFSDDAKDWASHLRKGADVVSKAIGSRWTVPWSAEVILQVMLLWVVSFWLIGSWVIPLVAHAAGFDKGSLPCRGQALLSVLTDLTEGLAGLAILHRSLSRFSPLAPDWFRFTLRGNWVLDVALGCLMFPFVNRLSQFNLTLLPLLPSTPVSLSSIEQSIAARDPVAMALYAAVVTVCAPVWEEIVFRGFLLPSLTRFMPVWCAILASSVAFALAHFSLQRLLPLLFLGVVMGAIFARSRNLLPPILLHTLWNAFVFLDLLN